MKKLSGSVWGLQSVFKVEKNIIQLAEIELKFKCSISWSLGAELHNGLAKLYKNSGAKPKGIF